MRGSLDRASEHAHEERDDEGDEEDEEQDLGDARGAGSDATEAQDRGDESDDEENGSPVKHGDSPFELMLVSGATASCARNGVCTRVPRTGSPRCPWTATRASTASSRQTPAPCGRDSPGCARTFAPRWPAAARRSGPPARGDGEALRTQSPVPRNASCRPASSPLRTLIVSSKIGWRFLDCDRMYSAPPAPASRKTAAAHPRMAGRFASLAKSASAKMAS